MENANSNRTAVSAFHVEGGLAVVFSDGSIRTTTNNSKNKFKWVDFPHPLSDCAWEIVEADTLSGVGFKKVED